MSEQYDADGVNHSVDLVQLASRYLTLTKHGNEYQALCPFHNDTTPPGNFSINATKQVWACFACNEHEKYGADAIGFLRSKEGLSFQDACKRLTNGGASQLPPVIPQPQPKLAKSPPRIVIPQPADSPLPDMATRSLGAPSLYWTYRAADNSILGYVARYETDEGKEYRPWTFGHYSDAEPPKWEPKTWPVPRPLYGIDRLAQRPTAQVLICEGEKAADAGGQLLPGMVAISWPSGANAIRHVDWAPLKGRKVVLCPDADDVGRKCMLKLSILLHENGAIEIKGIKV